MSYVDVVERTINSHIDKYERMLDCNENDCMDKELISAILEELHELKDEL